jgi:di/tricarboxylate transporter
MIFGYEPVKIVAALNALVALVVGFGLPLTADQTKATETIFTGLAAAAIWWMTKPRIVSGLSGILVTTLTGFAAFGLPVTGNQISLMVTAAMLVFGLLLRQNVSPVPAPARRTAP